MTKKFFSRRGGWSKHVDTTYRSGSEDRVSVQLRDAGIDAKYEEYKIAYKIPASNHYYTPDFVLPNGVIVEVKGLFDPEDRKKHLLIKKQNENLDIRFIFDNPNQKIYKGSKTSYADWCIKNNFRYATKYIPDAWFREKKKDTKGLIYKKQK